MQWFRIRVLLCLAGAVLAPARNSSATPLAPGDVLTVNEFSGAVHHYSASGADLGTFVTGLNQPGWVTIDSANNVWVSEYFGNRVDEFSPTGTLLLSITTPFQPADVAVRTDGTIFIGDYFGGGIYDYAPSGTPLGLFGVAGRVDFMTFDSAGNLYTDSAIGTIERFSPTGTDLGPFASGLSGVSGITFDSAGNLFAATFYQGFIEQYSPSGQDLGLFAHTAQSGNIAGGIEFGANGNLYVGGGVIQILSPTGGVLGGFTGDVQRDLAIVPQGPVPEPASLLLLGTGLLGVVGIIRRRRTLKSSQAHA